MADKDKADYFAELKLLEAVFRERLNKLDDFNRRAPYVKGLTLRINGEPFPWPVDTERHRVLLGLIGRLLTKLENAPRLSDELLAELQGDIRRIRGEAEAIAQIGSGY